MMEDLNAKVGSENSLLERFMEFCNFHRVVFGGKLLARSIGFWVTDNEHTSRKIDHIAINSRCRNSAVLTLASKGTIIWTERQFQIQYSRFHNPAVIQEENFFFLSIQPTRTFIFGRNELDATTLTAEMWKWIDKRKELRAPLMAPSGTEHDTLEFRYHEKQRKEFYYSVGQGSRSCPRLLYTKSRKSLQMVVSHLIVLWGTLVVRFLAIM